MLGVALSACSAPAPAALPDGVQVSLVQLRGDIGPGRVQLHVENDSDAPVTVSAAALSSPALSTAASWQPTHAETLSPGRAVNLPVLLPAVVCTDGDPAPAATLTIDSREVEASIPDDLGVLSRLVAAECAREAVEAVAHVEVTAVASAPDGIALELTVTPTGSGDGTMHLVGLRGTPLLRFAAGEEAPLDLDVAASDPPSTVSVTVEPRRCDAHAIAEDKVGTRLTLVAEAGGTEATYALPRSDELAARLLSLTAAFCGLTP